MSGLAIAWVEWRRLRREPSLLLFVVLLPLAVVSVFGPAYVAEEQGESRTGVVIEREGPVSDLVVRRLSEPGGLDVRRYASRSEAEQALRERLVDGVVVVPAGVERGTVEEMILIGPPGAVTPMGVRGAVERTAADVTAVLIVARGHGTEIGSEAIEQAERDLDVALPPRRDPVDLTSDARREQSLASALIGITVLFTFLNAMVSADIMAVCREQGILGRLRASGVPARGIVAGFAISVMGFAVVQAAIILAGATVLLGVSWPDPLPLVVVSCVLALAAAGLGVLAGTFLRSPTDNLTVVGPIGFLLGMLGGALWPLDIVPPLVAAIGHLTPQAWAVDALTAAGGHDDETGWGRPTVVLAGFAVLLLLAAVARLRSSVAKAA